MNPIRERVSNNLPKGIKSRHKLIAYTALLALKEYAPDKKLPEARAILHTTKKNARSLAEEFKNLGVTVIAHCDSKTCRWNEKGLDFTNGNDRELDINPVDTYQFDADIFILDEISEYIDANDARTFKSSIIIETGSYVTNKAKKALEEKGSQVIPHTFFDLYPLDSARPKNILLYASRIKDNWGKITTYAREKKTSFEFAMNRVFKERMA